MEQDNKEIVSTRQHADAQKHEFGLKNIIAPDVEARKAVRVKINDYAYYAIIGLISLLVIFIPPLFMGCLQSDIGIAFPKSLEGWIL